MNKGYGNFFYDVMIAIEYKYLKNRCENGCELSGARLKKIDDILVDDYNNLNKQLIERENDTLAEFCINNSIRDIKLLGMLLEPLHEQEQASYKCIINICEALKDENVKPNKKLKTLAYLKLAYRYKFNYNYDFMSKIITTSFITLFEENENNKDIESLIFNRTLLQFILRLLEGLTPRQVLTVFPIEKSFNGYKYGLKDYYSSMEFINDLGIDKPLTYETAKKFLMECMIGRFMFNVGVSMMSLVSDYNNWDINDVMGFIQDIKNEPHLKIIK